MPSHQTPLSFSRKAGDYPAWRRLTKSQEQENIIINRQADPLIRKRNLSKQSEPPFSVLDYLNYDRLGKSEVHAHLSPGAQELHQWIKRYRVETHKKRGAETPFALETVTIHNRIKFDQYLTSSIPY